jgi:CBS domain-containing protein/acyl dehydratase
MLVSLTVRDVMTEDVLTIPPDATAAAAAETLSTNHVGSVVVQDGGRPVGIVTESDVVDLFADRADPDETLVSAFMSEDLLVVGPDEPLERAAELLGEHDYRRLPVVEGEDLVGIVTVTDLSYYLPHLSRGRRAWTEWRRERPADGSTAYEDRDWEFDAEGVEDGLSLGDQVTFSKTLSAADVEAFADASGDTNRLHLDEGFAANSRFGGRIAHGILTAGTISAALARLPGLTIYLAQELSFLGPVRVDEEVTAICEILEALGGNKFRVATRVYDSDDELVVDGEAVVLIDTSEAALELPAESEATTDD